MTKDPYFQSKPWWNRPLVGNVSIIERILGALNPQKVPELALSLHDTELEELRKFEPTLRMLDNDQYVPEFLYFINIKQKLEKNIDDYKGIHIFVKIFTFAIKHINDFRTIRRIELDFQGKTQLDLYQFIEEQLNNNSDPLLFKQLVNIEIEELLSIIRNEPTKKALLSYQMALNNINIDQIGLNLLLLFKKYQISDYTIFNTINEILKQFKKQDLTNLKALVLIVKVNYEELDKIGKLIGISHNEDAVITYAKIIQYIALSNRYDNIIYRFQQLLDSIDKWHKHYQTVLEIRQKYPSHKYKVSPKFIEVIPGESIYFKYQDYLTADL
ncbi:hypothetical protein [Geminocystis sp. GBBB08]|uniref:hypothetical protein n=1 Tax=Geminocystis sp. GBBB08 TaxID=2604140 RepID=UPI0027E34802|nr:hypothetical protein [Geminocystis sp. GBBB08]MBL1209008.1 hypothetical protein [Geminocystis sp. GBBB08]